MALAGWPGTLAPMTQDAVRELADRLGAGPADLRGDRPLDPSTTVPEVAAGIEARSGAMLAGLVDHPHAAASDDDLRRRLIDGVLAAALHDTRVRPGCTSPRRTGRMNWPHDARIETLSIC